MDKVLIIIQARMASTRLPGKILMPLGDVTLLECLIHNLQKGEIQKEIIIATSKSSENDKLELFLKEKGIQCFRGSEDDVLSRFIAISKESDVKYIVRATADDPLMSGECLDILIKESEKNGYDYAFMKGLPIGVSPEVIRRENFLRLEGMSDLTNRDKEHVTIYFKEHPENFKIGYVVAPSKYYFPELSMTIDTMGQYKEMCCLYTKYGIELSLETAIKELNEKK